MEMTPAQVAADIREAVRDLLIRDDEWGTMTREVVAILQPGVTVERTLLTKAERTDLIEYLEILNSTTDKFNYPESIVVTIDTLAKDGLSGGVRRRKGFMSDSQVEIFGAVALVFLGEAEVQQKSDGVDEHYAMRNTIT